MRAIIGPAIGLLLLGLSAGVSAQQVDCAVIGGEIRLIESGGATSPSLAWTGSEYGLAWVDNRHGDREIYFANVDTTGNVVGLEIRVTNQSSDSIWPSLIWTGTEFALAWSDERDGTWEIYFARLDAAGTMIGTEVRITDPGADSGRLAFWPHLVWTGSEYGLAWSSRGGLESYDVYFARLDSTGAMIGDEVLVSTDGEEGDRYPRLAWTGSEYGLAWGRTGDPGAVLFARLSSAGVKIGTESTITAPDLYSPFAPPPDLEWTGTGYGVVYDVYSSGIWVVTLDATGNEIGSEQNLTVGGGPKHGTGPRLAWTGTEFGLVWRARPWGVPHDRAMFTNLDSAMGEIGDQVPLSPPLLRAFAPSLAWTGGEFGVAWEHEGVWAPSGRDDQIRFSRVACGCLSGEDIDFDDIGLPCDNCPLVSNTDQSDVDRDGLGDVCDPCTDTDGDGYGDPGYPANQCETDSCPDIADPDQTDADQDGHGAVCECDDTEPTVNPDEYERNDGLDNDCNELVDEGNADAAFCCDAANPPDCTARFCWSAQPGATMYEVLRSDDRRLRFDCVSELMASTEWDASDTPPAGDTYYYLHRPAAPFEGSWGPQSRAPYERFPPCAP